MDRSCTICKKEFRDSSSLRRHTANKKPCEEVEVAPQWPCPQCNRPFSSKDSQRRHIKLYCRAAIPQPNDAVVALTAKVEEMSAMIETLMQNGANVGASYAKTPDMSIAVHGDMVNAVNHVNAVNNVNLTVNIAPWGAPLSVTESDIEAALCDLPTDIPRTGEMVRALMEVVKRAHLPPEARNIYLNPKRTDQARALTKNGWAFLPLSEATQALFDGASAQIEKPPAIRVGVGQARTALPIHYRMDKANVVQMGMHPMGAHLANMAPGGVGPLLVEGKPAGAPSEITPAPAPAPTAPERFRKIVSEIPAAYSETGALHPGWIAEVVSKIAVSPIEFYKLLEMEAAADRFAEEWAGMQKLSLEKSKPRPSPADRP